MKKPLLYAMTAVVSFLLCADAFACTRSVRVMSFNVRIQIDSDTGKQNWEARKQACVNAVMKYKPDLIGLQEPTYSQRHYLAEELPIYEIVEKCTGLSAGDKDVKNVGNPILFRKDRFELLDCGFFWLNEDQTPYGKGWDAAYPRHVNWVKLRHRKSGQVIFFFNTHFDNEGSIARSRSSVILVDKIKEIAGDGATVFLAADFNVPGDDNALEPLNSYMKRTGIVAAKPDMIPSYNAFGRTDDSPMLIDHIFCRNAKVRSFKVVDGHRFGVDYISDHYPVYSDFFLPF